MVLGPLLLKIAFWKKKVAKFAQKYWKSQIFRMSNSHKLAEINQFVSQKFRLGPKSYQKKCFVPNSKIREIMQKSYPPQKKTPLFFGGGGGKIIKCLLTA
jgi:hypothetical protein